MVSIKNVDAELKAGRLILLLLVDNRADASKSMLKTSVAKGLGGVYVTIAEPYSSIVKKLELEKINLEKVLFLDAITVMISGAVEKTGKCIYVNSPKHLTDMSIALDNAISSMKEEKKFVLFDSLGALLIHNDLPNIQKFVHFFTAKMRALNVYSFLISLENEIDPKTLTVLSTFCDSVLKIKA